MAIITWFKTAPLGSEYQYLGFLSEEQGQGIIITCAGQLITMAPLYHSDLYITTMSVPDRVTNISAGSLPSLEYARQREDWKEMSWSVIDNVSGVAGDLCVMNTPTAAAPSVE